MINVFTIFLAPIFQPKKCDWGVKHLPYNPKVQRLIIFPNFHFSLETNEKNKCNPWITSSSYLEVHEDKELQLIQKVRTWKPQPSC